jgi:hypothetical protein
VPGILSSEIGRFGGAAHNLEEVEKLRIMAYQGEGAYEADVDYAHLTVDWIRNVKTDYAKHDSH